MENRAVLSRSAPPPDRTIRYGEGPDHVADCWSAPVADAPVVILWHGGFWRAAFDREHLRPMANALRDAGFMVVMPEYRRTGGGGGWPGTFDDVALASDRLPGLLAAEGIATATARIVHAGHSAGGQLAVWTARRQLLPEGSPWHREVDARIVGVLGLAPVVDLAEAYRLDLDGGAVNALLGGGPDAFPERYAVTDLMMIGGRAPSVTILHGDADGRVPVELSRRFAAAGFGTLVELPGADHFAVIDPESAVWPSVVQALRSFGASTCADIAREVMP
ncbi:MAG: alpha/beta hydrolase [Thermomicrobiales bacterium]